MDDFSEWQLGVECGDYMTSYLRKRSSTRFDDHYDKKRLVKLGFRAIDSKPQCLICLKTLSRTCATAVLREHLETEHPKYVKKPESYFRNLLNDMEATSSLEDMNLVRKYKSQMAVYIAAMHVVRSGSNYTLPEEIILPTAVDIAETFLGSSAAEFIKSIVIGPTSLTNRIKDLANDVQRQLHEKINNSACFSIQIQTNMPSEDRFSIFARYIEGASIQESMLLCSTVIDMKFKNSIFRSFMQSSKGWNLKWDKCTAICVEKDISITKLKDAIDEFIEQFSLIAPNAIVKTYPYPVEIQNIWITQPFNKGAWENLQISPLLLKALNQLWNDKNEEKRFHSETNLATFWITVPCTYNDLRTAALKLLIVFPKPYLLGSEINNRKHSKGTEAEIFLNCNITIKPNINYIVTKQKCTNPRRKGNVNNVNSFDCD